MDTGWVVAGLAVSLCVALSWVAWYLAASVRRERSLRAVRHHAGNDHPTADDRVGRPIHRFRGRGEAVTVAELLEEAVERGEGIRLNWPTDDVPASPTRADELGQWPTVVLPRFGELDDGKP